MVRINGGYIILNFIKYRDYDHSSADRSRRYRLRQKGEPSRRDATLERCVVTQAEAEYRVQEVPPTVVVPAAIPMGKPDKSSPRDEILLHWRAVAVPAGLPDVLKLSDKLCKAMDVRLRDSGWLSLFREAVVYAALSPDGAWMRGGGDRRWLVTLDWLLKPDKAEQIAAKARASPGRAAPLKPRPGAIAADAATQAQLQQLPTRRLLPTTGAP